MKYYSLQKNETYKSGDISVNINQWGLYLIGKKGRIIYTPRMGVQYWSENSGRYIHLCEGVRCWHFEPAYRKAPK